MFITIATHCNSTPMYSVTINTALLLLSTLLLTVTEFICLQIQCFAKHNGVPVPLLRLIPREFWSWDYCAPSYAHRHMRTVICAP